MYIIELTYEKNLDEVEKYLSEHKIFLDKYYKKNIFICSGRKNPRNGGIILCKAKNLEEIKAIIQEEPFNRENIAKYRVINFEPSKYKEEFKHCI